MKKKAGKIFLYTINLLCVFSLLIAYLAQYTSPKEYLFPAYFGLAYPVLLISNIIFVIHWLLHKKKLFAVSLTVILIGWYPLINTIQINVNSNNEQGKSLKILSYNVRMFDRYNWSKKKNTRSNILKFVSGENPEIVCLQEFYSSHKDSVPILDTLLSLQKAKYYHVSYSDNTKRNSGYGIATFSCYPIVNRGNITFGIENDICIFSDILINSDTLRIYNNHLASVHFNNENYALINNISDYDEPYKGLNDIFSKLNNAFIKRSKQVDKVASHIQNSPYPVIVCGDFNDTPVSYTYHKLRSNLEDTFVASGSGLGSTYTGIVLPVRIDFIFHDNTFQCNSFKIHNVRFSDHNPLMCHLSLTDKNIDN